MIAACLSLLLILGILLPVAEPISGVFLGVFPLVVVRLTSAAIVPAPLLVLLEKVVLGMLR